jgi:hypothetical protein
MDEFACSVEISKWSGCRMSLMTPMMIVTVDEWGGEVETTGTDDGIEVDIETRVSVSPCSTPCFNKKKGLEQYAMGTQSYTYMSEVYMIETVPQNRPNRFLESAAY